MNLANRMSIGRMYVEARPEYVIAEWVRFSGLKSNRLLSISLAFERRKKE